ncbi:DoxX family protein [Dongia rigui]|uniref:DoxX family protein n=1 Tax=Dongia rigui TaxID=940149 RepID=A0ABU5DSX7_9PROT|nr:DoxX family protein [Dongia rigui]MDY0870464.1 DoxX family protein [Dongia rigui]
MPFNRLIDFFSRVPMDLIALLARLGIAVVFLRSGLLKLDGWDNGNTLALFQYEYQLPLIPPQLAAPMAMAMELAMPMFLFAGLGTRFAALALLCMTAVIEIFVYPGAFDTHAVWAVSLLFLIKNGAGHVSLDHLIATRTGQRPAVAR